MVEVAHPSIWQLRGTPGTRGINIMQVKRSPSLDAPLADICIGSSAAPTYFPAYFFKNQDKEGKARELNLIDGGVAANNPVR